MKKENYTFISSDDLGTKIHGVCWSADDDYASFGGRPVALLQLVHGMIEYIERYEEFAQYLVDRGFAVVGHDHIGHGHSVSELSDKEWGIMHCSHPEEVKVEDILTNYKLAEHRYPGVPHFILGHSMGSFMTRRFLSVKADELNGLKGAILMGTGTTPDVALHVARAVVRIVKRFHGRDYKSRFVTNFLFAGDYHKFNMDGSVPEDSWLSTNVESVRKYYADPMDTYLFSVNGYLGLIRAMYFDNQIRNIEKIRKDLPVLFVSGANDPVGSLGKGVKKAYEKFQKAGLKDVTMRLYEGDRHEILQEMDREKVFSDLYQWMIRQIG